MQADNATIDIQRAGQKCAVFSVKGLAGGRSVKLTHPELDDLIAELSRFSANWRASTVPDYYATLGLDQGASQQDIKQAYRKLAKALHSDVGAGDDARLKEVNAAHEVLSDPARRKQYDMQCAGGGN